MSAEWPYSTDAACRLIAAAGNPNERKENRDDWAVTMPHRPDVFAIEAQRARTRLEQAIAHVAAEVAKALAATDGEGARLDDYDLNAPDSPYGSMNWAAKVRARRASEDALAARAAAPAELARGTEGAGPESDEGYAWRLAQHVAQNDRGHAMDLADAIRLIEQVAGSSEEPLKQPGAAWALGVLGEVAGVGPGWDAERVAAGLRGTEGADERLVLPDPKGGCACTPFSQSAGGVYVEHLAEYEPACPEHSEHVYNPRTGVWDLAAPVPSPLVEGEEAGLTEAEKSELRYLDPIDGLVQEEVQRRESGLREAVARLADTWDRENRRPQHSGDQVTAGVWAATKADAAELRALLVAHGGDRETTSEGWSVAGSNAGPWSHEDGTSCPTYWASKPKPDADVAWWCTEHQQYVRPTDSERGTEA
jgi:hypothetical protein